MNKGLLIVLSGPSGAGKGTVNAKVRKILPRLKKSVSVTTREKRYNEIDGVHYTFVSVERFEQMIANNEFIEYAKVYDNYYGTPSKPVIENLNNGYDIIFELDIQGSRLLKAAYDDCIRIFIAPPSLRELTERLALRNTECDAEQKKRLKETQKELEEALFYDYIVINDDADEAANKVVNIINAERCKTSRNVDILRKITKGDRRNYDD